MVYPIFRKFCSLILCFVQANNVCNSKVFEDLQIVFWAVTPSIGTDLVNWAHESDEFSWHDPVQITIFDLLVILVLLVVKVSKVVPAVANSDLQTFQAMVNGAAVGAVAITGISERPETCLVRCKSFPSDLGGLAKNHYHEGTHEVGCICLLVENVTAVVENFDIFVSLICQNST